MPSLFAELPYREDTVALFETIADEPWAVFLDSGRHLPGHSRFDILAADPAATLVTRGNMTEIRGSTGTALSPDDPFALVRRHLGTPIAPHPTIPFCGGAIGYFAYDLGRRLERLPVIAEDVERIPEMAVGIYDWACVVDHHERRTWLVGAGREPETQRRWGDLIRGFSEPARERYRTPFRVTSSIASNLTPDGYARAFRRIQQYIANGDCYQVNLAQRFAAAATGDPWLAYQALRILNPAPFAAYLNLRFVQVLSASPERFLRVRDGLVETKPIKGTRPRAGHPRLDAALAEVLKESDKDRAENVMIVDLLRNDLSKTCELGSVKVPKLFDVESFATVHHLVSTVTGELRPRIPCGGFAARVLSREARSRARRSCARWKSSRSWNPTGAASTAAPSAISGTTVPWIPTSRSAPWCTRAAPCASGPVVASSPTRGSRRSTRNPSTRLLRC